MGTDPAGQRDGREALGGFHARMVDARLDSESIPLASVDAPGEPVESHRRSP